MISFPSSARVWLAVGRTDMRRGMNGLALQVQESLGRNPHLCVGLRYVAARSGSKQSHGDGDIGRHIISDLITHNPQPV